MEQRRHSREKIGAPAIMRMAERPGGFLVTVLDVSKTGLRINSSIEVSDGAKVAVTCKGATVEGEVRYTRVVGSHEFHIGIEASNGSPEVYSPTGELDVTLIFKRPG